MMEGELEDVVKVFLRREGGKMKRSNFFNASATFLFPLRPGTFFSEKFL
jgi:hypothetical protein